MSSDNNGSFKSGSLKDNIVSYSFIFKGKKKHDFCCKLQYIVKNK